ncbi:polysaccharide pyruvyl transferase family protein [Photobacterium sanguinicancri]|uniref:polysaccharide pyruvyl transferase family protein n=1 Tax=Photobacterium sanguinicancri TaxID=875932 RepID=UPI003D1425AF
MEKKIGLITFHDTANHGAALQNFATLFVLNKMGYKSEAINYTNDLRSSLYNLPKKIKSDLSAKKYSDVIKAVIAAPLILNRMANFNKFYEQFTPRSELSYNNTSDLSSIENNYDHIIIGSDQVWSTTNNGSDGTYYLNFVTDKSKTISYASSFGTTCIDDTSVTEFASDLSKIKHISVREKTGKAIFEKLTGRVPAVVLDPVFLLSDLEWIEVIKSKYECNKMLNDRFVDYTANKSYLKAFFKVKGTEKFKNNCYKFGTALGIRDVFDTNVHLKFACDPIDFMYSLYNSSLIFTSSFHGVVLSIIFKKKFIVVLSGNVGRDSRIIDLLSSLGLSERIFSENMIINEIDQDINYDEVHSRLNTLRNDSLKFLENSLN